MSNSPTPMSPGISLVPRLSLSTSSICPEVPPIIFCLVLDHSALYNPITAIYLHTVYKYPQQRKTHTPHAEAEGRQSRKVRKQAVWAFSLPLPGHRVNCPTLLHSSHDEMKCANLWAKETSLSVNFLGNENLTYQWEQSQKAGLVSLILGVSCPGLVGGRGLGLKSAPSEVDMPTESGFGGLCARVVPVLPWRSSGPTEQY